MVSSSGVFAAVVTGMVPVASAYSARAAWQASEDATIAAAADVPPSVTFIPPVHVPLSLAAVPAAAEEQPAEVVPPRPDTATFLRAIAEVESRGNPRRIGRLGERGLYQFRQGTWRQHTREHFSRAHHPGAATAVARRHYHWIRQQLLAHGRAATPYEVALAWNAGVNGVLTGRAPARAHAYAERVVNLAGRS